MQCRDVDTAATLLTAGLTRVLDEMAPVRTIQSRQDYAPHMGEETKQLLSRRNSAQERAVHTGVPEDWRDYSALRNLTTASLRRDLASWRRRKLNSAENSPSAVWSAVKRILNWEGGGPPTQLLYQGKMLNKPAAVASAIDGFFIKKVKDIISGIPRVDTDPLAKLRERMAARRCSLNLRLVTEGEVLKVIQKIKPTTTTGVDFIDNQTIKLVADIVTPALTHIANLSISTATFPTIYKWAKVTPLLKKATLDPILPASYRPVNTTVSAATH